jgi:putative Ig domain-containing protein/WD40 repeat protein
MRGADRLIVLIILAIAPITLNQSWSFADCPGLGPIGEDPNVGWVQLPDSITTCPAGDSVLTGHPSRVRAMIFYGDDCHNPRVGVPPDSIWIRTSVVSGNLIVNDQPNRVFAEDSTNSLGYARFELPSVSGCGRLRLSLYVSGVAYDSLTVTVRSVDASADGRVSNSGYDWDSFCDVNYDGALTSLDRLVINPHNTEWHRNALIGTPIQRTNLTSEPAGSIGDGSIAWEPNGDRLALSVHTSIDPTVPCALFLVHSDPKDGNTLVQITHPPGQGIDDYSPAWSPFGQQIAWDRGIRAIWSKNIVTGESLLVTSSGDEFNPGDNDPAYSPNGAFIAFSRNDPTSSKFHIYKINLDTAELTPLTSGSSNNDRFPSWTPDGAAILFERNVSGSTYGIYKVAAGGGTVAQIYSSGAFDAILPAAVPDGRLVLASVAPATLYATRTIEPSITNPHGIVNYSAFAGGAVGEIHPVMSPDGTRLAFVGTRPGAGDARQLWAVRRNMNLPPTLAAIGNKTVHRGDALQFAISASDPESNPLAYAAAPLTNGMTFNSTTRTFSWTPPVGSEGVYYVRFTASDSSGGADWEAIHIYVTPLPGRPLLGPLAMIGGGNPSSSGFSIATPHLAGADAELLVYNVAGRCIARCIGPSGKTLKWNGVESSGRQAAPGVYFYSLRVKDVLQEGRWIVVR